MVRPENVTLLADGQTAPIMRDGVVEDVIFVGSVTNFRVRLTGGEVVTAKQLTSAHHAGRTVGQAVRIGWAPDSVRPLAS